MGVSFRRARGEDAAALVALVEELGHPASAQELRARLVGLLDRSDHALFVGLNDAAPDELVGWVHVQAFHSLAGAPTGLVTGLVVAPAARRKGVGRGLMRLAEDWARARGLTAMRLRAHDARRAAHTFYRNLGYRLAKRQLQFRKSLE